MTTQFAVFVNAPGCLPDSDDLPVFDTFQDALEYARQYCEDCNSEGEDIWAYDHYGDMTGFTGWTFTGFTLTESEVRRMRYPVIVGHDPRGFYRISIGVYYGEQSE